ncbi:DUF917 domain-containing protein [Lactococcus allomyrinae]|uniref:DUF917 family protein n=1 Tax=Lactococcus allomyrinae TaxID=2419773 RepID=A0A387BDK6_9LACT|nr:DUF917 family protein [Lactococcus allomyrinae]AYG00344.1 DUF917 family protein [Lactococcus allomyrinae]
MVRKLTKKDVLAAVKGGAVFASGGGAFYEHGLKMGYAALALGDVNLISIDELPDDATLLTQTAIGAPAGTTDWQMQGKDYIKAVQLVQEQISEKIVGLWTPQNGKSSSTNGWITAAALGLYIVDVTGDIRAHPTGEMGDIGVNSRADYITTQAAVGGKHETGKYVEVVVKGASKTTSKILRAASDQAGGFIATARHPLPVKYVKENAVIGGLSKAINLGYRILAAEGTGAKTVINNIAHATQGEVITTGCVVSKEMSYTTEAFDIGKIQIVSDNGHRYTVYAQNEFMAIENENGERISTYPDVQTIFRAEDAFPLSTNEIEKGQEVVLFKIDKSHFQLSTGVKDAGVYPDVEKALGIELYKYSFPNDENTGGEE